MTSEVVLRVLIAAAGFAVVSVLWARSRVAWEVRSWPPSSMPLAVAAIAAGVAIVLPGPTLVGNDIIDAAWRGIFVGGLTGAAASSPIGSLAVALAVLTAFVHHTEAGGAAAAVLGVLVGLMACGVRRVPPVAAALVGVAIVLISTRPDAHPGLPGYVAPVAAVVLVGVGPLFSKSSRRVTMLFGIIGFAAVGLGLGLGALASLRAESHLNAGLRAARGALDAAKAGDALTAGRRLADTEAELRAGRASLDVWWAKPARSIPIAGVNLQAVDSASAAGIELSRVGSDLVAAARLRSVQVAGGRVPLETLHVIENQLVRAVASLGSSRRLVGGLHSRWIVRPVSSRLSEFDLRLRNAQDSAERALDGERLAYSMLGGDSTLRRYLVAFTSPSELRGATGLMGNYGEMTVQNGAISLSRFGLVTDVQARGPTTPDGLGWDPEFVTLYGTELANALWQNLTLSPDFPTIAHSMETLYPRSGGTQIDGVVAVDPSGLGALLAVEGPVSIPLWPQPISAENIAAVLEHDEYVRYPVVAEREAFLAQLASTVVGRLRDSSLTDVGQLLRTFGAAVKSKHLMIASSHPSEQAALLRLGGAGAVPPVADDSLGVLTSNGGGNKIDWYLRRSITYKVQLDATHQALTASLDIDLSNGAPAEGEPPYLIHVFGSPPLPTGTNRLILSVLTPWVPQSATLDGSRVLLAQGRELGRNLLSVEVDIPPGASRTVHIDLAGLRRSAPYRLDVLHQPAVLPDLLHIAVRGTRDVFHMDGPLTTDLVLTGGASG